MKKANQKVQTSEPKKTKNEVAKAMNKPAELTATEKREFKTLTTAIDRELGKVETSYLKVAITLFKIHSKQLYKAEGYKNIYEFGSDRFNLARGTVNNFINLVHEYCITLNGELVLKEKYDDFSPSKLIAMLNMPLDFKDTITPDMSVRAIKDKKREYRQLIDDAIDSDTIDADFREVSSETVKGGTKSKKSSKTDESQLVFETAQWNDFFEEETAEAIGDMYQDFAKKHKGKKIKYCLYFELVW